MKRICFTLLMTCLVTSGAAQAEIWGRVISNPLVARTQEKIEPEPELNSGKSAIQAPSAVQAPLPGDVQNGYPFADRCCGPKLGCCANIWDGYVSPLGCGLGRGMFAHSMRGGCGWLPAKGCQTECGTAGHFNSFAGGVAYSGCDCGTARGLGWHACKLHTLAASGKHHLQNLRRACGLGCNSNCHHCGESSGCNGCNGKGHYEGGEKGMMPPAPPGELEPTPMTEKMKDAPPAPMGDKSAFRPGIPSVRRSPLGF